METKLFTAVSGNGDGVYNKKKAQNKMSQVRKTFDDVYSQPANSAQSQILEQKATRAETYLKSHPEAVKRSVDNESGSTNRIMENARKSAEEKKEEHDHAYVHKVEPIDTVSVVDSEDTTIAQLRSKRAESDRRQEIDKYKTRYADRNAAKNGDRIEQLSSNETFKICSYCGAKNIVPRHISSTYTCYFCREEL